MKRLSEKISNSYCVMEKGFVTKLRRRRTKDEAVRPYWNNKRVVPTKVNGKTTYVVICSNGMRHQELFPPEVTRRSASTLDSGLHHHTVSRHDAVNMVTSRNRTSKGHVNGRNSGEESSAINLAETYEQQMFVAEKPLTSHDSEARTRSSISTLHSTPKKSAVEDQQSVTIDEQEAVASRDLFGSDTDDDDCNSSNKHANLKFYLNCIKSQPAGEKIEHILCYWYGDYKLLEDNHNYIQWLFPTKSLGVNRYAQPLTDNEAEVMRTKQSVRIRLIQAYKMMLDFYGLELCSVESGHVARAVNWRERFRHLNHSCHNYQRITRILDSVGMLGAAYLQVPFVTVLIDEVFLHKTLPNAASSCQNYWIPAVLGRKEKRKLLETVNVLKSK